MAQRPHAYDMSFLEDAEDEGVPQYEGTSPPSTVTSGTPSSAGTRPPSLLARSPSEKSTSKLVGLRGPPLAYTPKSAEVEAWRREQAAGDGTEEPIPTEQLSQHLSRMLHVGGGDENTKSVRLEDMTDAEIAQHHFRLAQQHLQAAQRLALAAATAPPPQSNAPSSAPSISSASSTSRARPPAPSVDTHVRYAGANTPLPAHSVPDASSPLSSYAPSSVASRRRGPHFSGDSYRTANDALSTSPSAIGVLSRLTGYHTASQARTDGSDTISSAPGPSTSAPPSQGPPSLVHTDSSALSTRSAPTSASHLTQRPVPPPRRSTMSSSVSTGAMEHASSLVPSLYGGGLPANVLDRMAAVRSDGPNAEGTLGHPAAAGGFASEADFVAYAASTAGSNDHREILRDDDSYSLAPTTADDTWDDGRSDFYGSESVFSHVTRATLPGYDDALQPVPPVPTIPTRYMATHEHAGSDPREHASAVVGTAISTPPLAAPDEFHGFRPRQTQTSYMHGLSPVPTTTRSSTLPLAVAHMPSAPQSLANVQPQAYVIGPAGQPIPVYSSAAFGPGHSASARPVAPILPVHARPLQFQHALSYTGQPAVVGQVTYSNPNVSAAGPAPTLTSHSSSATLPRPGLAEPVTRPTSAWSDNSDQSNADARSIAAGSTFSRTKSRMASLRAKVPHVRFMSPDPTVLRAPRGTGPARQAPRTGARRSTASGGVATNDVIAEQQEGESEEEREKRQRAIQMSLGMLI